MVSLRNLFLGRHIDGDGGVVPALLFLDTLS